MDPASIRYNNPGAMWGKGNKIATKWGSLGTTNLNDGLGQGNNIAFFPTKVKGACAQFDLWRTGYCNRTLREAILRWSGGNWSDPYARFLVAQTGISLDEQVTPALLASPRGWKLMKAQAQWEAGRPYPLLDSDWIVAQRTVFSSTPMTVEKKKAAAATSAVVVSTASAAGAAKAGVPWEVTFAILILGIVVAVIGVWWVHQKHEEAVTPSEPHPPGVGPQGQGG